MDINKYIKTPIRISAEDGDGNIVWEANATNTLTRGAMGVFINALLGKSPSKVAYLYARFGNDANPGWLSPTGADLKETTRDDFVTTSDAYTGGLWVPLLFEPAQSTTDSLLYSGNKATYTFRIPYTISTAQIDPAGNWDNTDRKIYSLGLAVARDASDRTQDIIISALEATGSPNSGDVNAFTASVVPASGQLNFDYPLIFQLP